MIPEITNQIGQSWHQPKVSNILIDETHALMSEDDYKLLSNYEMSFPTASYVGKMFRRGGKLVWIDKDTTGRSPSGLQYFYRDILIL